MIPKTQPWGDGDCGLVDFNMTNKQTNFLSIYIFTICFKRINVPRLFFGFKDFG
jgi:hypothetical protein